MAEVEAVLIREALVAKAMHKLQQLAISRWHDGAKAEFWLSAHDPKLGGRPKDLCLDHYEACVEALKAARFS